MPGTYVLLADGTYRPIEDVVIGDIVLTTDPITGVTAAKEVTGTTTSTGPKELVELSVDRNGQQDDVATSLIATANHPFWIPEAGAWIEAGDLQARQGLRTVAGTRLEIGGVRSDSRTATVHNLSIADIHAYYVLAGNAPALVHNTGPDCAHAVVGLQEVGDNRSALDEFAFERGGQAYADWPGRGPWYKKFQKFLAASSTTRISVNLDGIDDPIASARAGARVDPSGYEGLTNWELHQISKHPGAWGRVTIYRGGKAVANPFG